MKNYVLHLQTAPAVLEFDKTTTPHMHRFRKELIRVGQYVKESAGLAFEVTRKTLEHWVATFERWSINGNKVPIPLGHDAADNPEKNQGWVKNLLVVGDSLFAIMELIDPAMALTTDVSIYVPAKFVDGKGRTYVQPIAHVALCTNPVVPGLKGFEQLSLSNESGELKMDKKKIAKLLGLAEDADEAAIMAAITKTKAAPAKALSQASELSTKDPIVNLVRENRAIKVAGLVKAGLITPAAKTAIEEQYTQPESLALTLSGGWDDGFDFLLRIIAENKTVPLGENSNGQLLELTNTRAVGEVNPIAADVEKRRTEAGMDK